MQHINQAVSDRCIQAVRLAVKQRLSALDAPNVSDQLVYRKRLRKRSSKAFALSYK